MATFQVVFWRDIPLQVRAREHGKGRESKGLSVRFQQAADAAAVEGGLTDSDSYLAEMKSGEWVEREGSAHGVVEAVAAELENEYPDDRLKQLVRAGGRQG